MSEQRKQRRGEAAMGDPLSDVEGIMIDPFAAGGLGEDPIALAERVAFRLWSDGDVSGRAIEQARKDAAGGRIDQVLVRQGLANPELAARALAEELNAPFADLDAIPARPVLGDALPKKFVAEASALPLADDGEVLRLALADPLDDFTLRAIAMKTRRKLEVFVASAESIREAIAQIYRGGASADVRTAEPRRIFDEPPAERPAPKSAPRRAAAPAPAREERSRPVAVAPRRPAPKPAPRPEPEFMEEAPVAPAPEAPRERPRFQRAAARRAAVAGDAPRFAPRRAATPELAQASQPLDMPIAAAPSRLTSPAPRAASADGRAAAWGVAKPVRAAKVVKEPPIAAEDDLLELSLDQAPVVDEKGRRAAPAATVNDFAHLRDAPSPRSSGVVAPTEEANGGVQRPRFVRPKRVTLKNRTDDLPLKAESARMGRQLAEEMEFDPLAIPPMEEDAPFAPEESQKAERLPIRKRFLRGFVGGFTGDRNATAEMDEESGPPAPVAAQRLQRDGAARRRVATEVRAALRDAAAEEPEIDAYDQVDAFDPDHFDASMEPAAVAQGSDRAETRRSALAVLDDENIGQLNAPAYQAAMVLAQRERRRESARSAEAAQRQTGAAVRHQLTTKKIESQPQIGPKTASVIADLEALGYMQSARDALENAVRTGEGLILICGPSGAGKTGTAAALAKRCAGSERDIERFDRPVEQRESDSPDSDLVLIGAISDAESADSAARAAMRGALVIATLDVESVASAAPRLISMGLPPFALASCLRAVAAQHQVPRNCARCAGSGRGVKDEECVECDGTGVQGEVNIVEVMALDDAMRALILARAPEEAFRHAMSAAGAPTLADDAAAKVAAGITSPDGAAAATAAARL